MRKILLSSLIIITGICHAQTNQLSVPNVIPPAPVAMELQKYINYPVDLSNGLVKISIPLYEIVDGDIRIPITLNYHASGIKPGIRSNGWLGDGWSLNTGPSLSRNINGLPDEAYYSYYMLANSQPTNQQLNMVANQKADIALDEFYYTLLNTSGRLYFKRDINNNLKPVTIPIDPIKITLPVANKFDRNINISDTKGLQYYFGGTDQTLQDFLIDTGWSYDHVPIGWKINKIYSPLTNRTVSFDYSSITGETPYFRATDAVIILDEINTYIPNAPIIMIADSTSYVDDYNLYTYNYGNQQLVLHTNHNEVVMPAGYSAPSRGKTTMTHTYSEIKSIRFSGGYVVFTKNENGRSGLTSIRVYDNNNSLVKQIEFVQYTIGSQTTLYLDKIKVTSSSPSDIEQYSFTYKAFVLNKETRSLDKWGYYNGAHNSTLVPTVNTQVVVDNQTKIVPITIPGGNREPNETAMQAGMLTDITYPTGGSTHFTYEAHRYQDDNGKIRLAGGLRIKQIQDIDEKGRVKYRNFSYSTFSNSNNGIGLLNSIPTGNTNPSDSNFVYYSEVKCHNFFYNDTTYYYLGTLKEKRWCENSLVNLFSENGSSVSYPYVTETTSSDSQGTNIIGKQMHCYNINPSHPIKYGTTNLIIDSRDGWSKGNQISATTFKNNTSNALDTVAHQEQCYTLQSDSDVNKVTQWYVYKNARICGIPEEKLFDIYSQYQYLDVSHLYQTLSAGKQILNHQYDYTYGNNGALHQTTDYNYDPYWNVKQVTKSTSTSSTTKDIMTYMYAKDKIYQGLDETGVYISMANNNIISIPMEVKRYKNSVKRDSLLTTLTTNYAKFNNLFFAPSEMISQVKTDPNLRRVGFNSYDNYGNILEQQNVDGTKDVYLWGYWGQHPVAKIVGSDLATVLQKVDTSYLYRGAESQKIAQLTNLRNGFSANPNVQVSTFMYKPLIGMISATDPRGVTINYTYDTFNRLYLTRNDDKNILARYRYAYHDNPDNGRGGYAALTSSLQLGATSYQLNSTGSSILTATGGSGNYSYNWTLKNSSGSVLASNTSGIGFSFICTQAGSMTVQCVVTDNLTGQSSTATGTFLCIGTLTAVIQNVSSSYSLNSAVTPSISVSGGFGGYRYDYYLKNSSGTVVASNLNGNYTCSLTCSQVGNMTLTCVVTDTQSQQTATASTTFNVNYSGSMTLSSNFTSAYNSISTDGTTVSFGLMLVNSQDVYVGSPRSVGTIPDCCRPKADRTVTISTGGRSISLLFNSSGQVYFTVASGSILPASSGTYITGSYSLN